MPRIRYIEKTFQQKSINLIVRASEIIDDYQAQGFVLTLRQLYYQLVTRNLIRNQQREYNRLGNLISDARLAGLIDWYAIEDRTRNLHREATYESPADILRIAAQAFQYDPWEDQPCHVEVWVEKEALAGVIQRSADKWICPSLACKGYMSQSEIWTAGQRLKRARDRGQKPVIIHLGDHDPSGIDMTRDITERLRMFAETRHVQVIRIALNLDQIEEYDPPPNPAKMTDSRFQSYQEQFGNESWELDALNPETLDGLISAEIESLIDAEPFRAVMDKSEAEREKLLAFADNWK